MRGFFTAGAVIAALVTAATAQDCGKDSLGNSYCSPVQRIEYNGVGGTGSYKKVTNMPEDSQTCSFAPQSYTGSMSPMNEEVSMHFRGPLVLKQFAVYTPSASSPSKVKRSSPHARRHAHGHGHQHFHEHNKEIREAQELAELAERAVGDVVVATINGKVVSWVNQYDGNKAVAAATPAASSSAKSPAAAAAAATSSAKAPARPSAAASSAAASSKASSPPATYGSGAWNQIAYYNADSHSATGLTFLNNRGDNKNSGVWSLTHGNSLSYASADGRAASASPVVFGSTLDLGDDEIAIMSDKKCADGSCGYHREGAVAYHGFDGAQKAFFMEFQMPNNASAVGATNTNMPSVWMLNAQIPRTQQYGDCSCWQSGCGEFDILEVLAPGESRCKSTLHGNIAGGSSDYFVRPEDKPIKVAVVMNNDNIVIQILDANYDFKASINDQAIKDICENNSNVKSSKSALG